MPEKISMIKGDMFTFDKEKWEILKRDMDEQFDKNDTVYMITSEKGILVTSEMKFREKNQETNDTDK